MAKRRVVAAIIRIRSSSFTPQKKGNKAMKWLIIFSIMLGITGCDTVEQCQAKARTMEIDEDVCQSHNGRSQMRFSYNEHVIGKVKSKSINDTTSLRECKEQNSFLQGQVDGFKLRIKELEKQKLKYQNIVEPAQSKVEEGWKQ